MTGHEVYFSPGEIYNNPKALERDGRDPLEVLYQEYFKLVDEHGWSYEIIHTQTLELPDGTTASYNIYGFKSPLTTDQPVDALWLIGTIHGEEPGPAKMFAQQIQKIAELARSGIPVVFIPIANPLGYANDLRYENTKRRTLTFSPFNSVTDADHVLSGLFPDRPHSKYPTSETSGAFLSWIIKTSEQYVPDIVFNHHDDEWEKNIILKLLYDAKKFYAYAYGPSEMLDTFCADLRTVIEKASGFTMDTRGRGKFGKIINGFIYGAKDRSVDAFFASDHYFDAEGKIIPKKPATLVFVPEAPIANHSIQTIDWRSQVHSAIVPLYKLFWDRSRAMRPNPEVKKYQEPVAKGWSTVFNVAPPRPSENESSIQ